MLATQIATTLTAAGIDSPYPHLRLERRPALVQAQHMTKHARDAVIRGERERTGEERTDGADGIEHADEVDGDRAAKVVFVSRAVVGRF